MPLSLINTLQSLLSLDTLPLDSLTITHADPVYPTPFRIGEAAAAALALQGLILEKWRRQAGYAPQQLQIDTRIAAASTIAVAFQRQNGHNWVYNDPDYPTVDFYPTRDGRVIFLHGGYPSLRDGILDLLDCAHNRQKIAQAVKQWDAQALEDALAERGLCGAIARSHDEWLQTAQGQAVAQEPLISIKKIADSAPVTRQWQDKQVLAPLRVLDFTHVIAGPTSSRILASMGADVLHISHPTRPRILPFDVDTNHGKHNAWLDLNQPDDLSRALHLVQQGDVFVQSYRPQALARRGLSESAMLAHNPHLIMVNLNCYGHTGPWCNRPGFEQLAQTVSGMAVRQGSADKPTLGPTYPNDYLSGYLAVLGVLTALERQQQEGGAWQVNVSLSKTASWLYSLGEVSDYQAAQAPDEQMLTPALCHEQGPYGSLRYFGHVLQMEKSPLQFNVPASPLGAHPAQWQGKAR